MSETYTTHTIGTNPILKMDYPDPDVIFVDGTFYMISTTMHYMPGAEILRSYDLINWEHETFVYDKLDSTEGQRLCDDKYIYGKGMWAATIRFHEGMFYVVFVCNDTEKTYLYRAENINGPWSKSEIEGFYHDCSLLFDGGKAYLVYGNTEVYLTELNEEMTGPKEGGLHRLIVSDKGNPNLGYEGAHLYKINGKYYLFFIHSLWDKWRRVEACFVADSLEGEFVGGDIFDDDMGFRNSGIAQGGIVEGPEGVWNAVLFQDSGAVGRIPVLVPVTWESEAGKAVIENEDRDTVKSRGGLIFGKNGRAPEDLKTVNLKPGYAYKPLVDSDDFRYDIKKMFTENKKDYGCFGLRSIWQFNHEPDMNLIESEPDEGRLWIKTDRLSENVFHARNTLTQRTRFPKSTAEVTIDGSLLSDGDYAGLAAFQGDYALVGIRKEDGKLYAAMTSYTNDTGDVWKLGEGPGVIEEKIELSEESTLKVRVTVIYNDETGDRDAAICEIYDGEKFRQIGTEHKLRFRLDHFTGCRFGLFVYSEKTIGGKAGFSDFAYI